MNWAGKQYFPASFVWGIMARMRYAPLALAVLLAACSKPAEPTAEPAAAPAGASASAVPEAAEPALVAAAPESPISKYTSLKNCKVIEDRGGEDWSVSRCKGLGGYTLQLNYFDARESLDLLKDGKVMAELKLWLRGGGGFNALGDRVEWRGTMRGGAFVPRALIVRNNVIRDSAQPERSTGVLEVIDLKRGCMAGAVELQPGQNEAARAIADAPPEECVKFQPER